MGQTCHMTHTQTYIVQVQSQFSRNFYQVSSTGYHIFADRWYMTRALMDYLLSKGQYLTGTVNTNSVGFPLAVKTLKTVNSLAHGLWKFI